MNRASIAVSAPHRLDIGGTWDLKAFGMLYRKALPCTLNIAISLRTHVRVSDYKTGYIKVVDPTGIVECSADSIDFNNRHGLVLACCAFMGISGIKLEFDYEAPNRSGLGGSGVLASVTIVALQEFMGAKDYSLYDTALIIQHLEDGLRFSCCGLQDQCAALWGGINLWHWDYDLPAINISRRSVLLGDYREVSDRIVVAYIGHPHNSSDVNDKQLQSLLNGDNSKLWFRINDITKQVATSLDNKAWWAAIELIKEETAIRDLLAPNRLTPTSRELRKCAESIGASFAASGAGNGGCVWALCEDSETASGLKTAWESSLAAIEEARVLDIAVVSDGILIGRIT